jgi:hypothetical protein
MGPITNEVNLAGCCTSTLASLSRAAAKSLAATLRSAGVGAVAGDWARRAILCERCHLLVVVQGVSHCGRPLLQQIRRDPSSDGCGCPTRQKAQSPSEHCPLNAQNQRAQTIDGKCDCKWCA